MVPSNLAENLGVAAQSGALVITDPGDGKIVACVKCGGTLLVDAVAAQSAKMETPANAGFFLFVSNKSAASEDFVITRTPPRRPSPRSAWARRSCFTTAGPLLVGTP
jgi:hypothetical protein